MYSKYLKTLLSVTGMGEWSVNTSGVEYIAKKYDIDDDLSFLEKIQVLATILMQPRKAQESRSEDNG